MVLLRPSSWFAALLPLWGCGTVAPVLPSDSGGVVEGGTYVGTEVFLLGRNEAPEEGAVDCTLVWSVTGASSALACDGCSFVLDVSLAYEPARSVDDGSCAGLQASRTATWAFHPDWGPGYGALLEWQDGAWAVRAPAGYAEETGVLSYEEGVRDELCDGTWWTWGWWGEGTLG